MDAQLDTVPLIRTKLHRPPVTADLVRRDRLLELMDGALEAPLTLVSAPAGYGKSVLVAQWAEVHEHPCAWLSLDAEDGDLREFLRYFVAAVDSVVPGACNATQELLTAGELPPIAVLAGHLVNELDAIDCPCSIVLDDYHRIHLDSSVHELVNRLLEHPPQGVRLVLITRRDPPVRVSSLLAGGGVIEVRLQDLRFTAPESREFLRAAMALDVTEEALANLGRQCDGWAVGLRLVSLALRHAADPDALLRGLDGGIPQIQKYLLHEILERRNPRMRQWLLQTSILDRFCPELCDAVDVGTGSDDRHEFGGRQFVTEAQQGDLFVIPLDAQGKWFRYHHFFRDLLQRQLTSRVSDEARAAMHIRAGKWFESEGLITEAIDHALAGGDVLCAAETIEQYRHAELDEDRWYVIERWINRLPDEVTQQRPGLLLARAWVALHRFQLIELPPLLDRVASLLADEDELRAELLILRGSLQFFLGDAENSVRSCEEAAGRLTGERGLIRGHLEMFLNMARSMRGDTDLALGSLREGLRRAGSAGGIYTARLIAGIGFISQTSGELDRVKREARRLRALAAGDGIAYTEGIATYMEAWAHLHALELDRACRDFARATSRRHILHARTAVDAIAGLALTHQLLQQSDASDKALDCLQDFARDDPVLVPVAESCRARLDLLRGDASPALELARLGDLAPQPLGLYIWLEVPAVTRARVLIEAGTEESLSTAIDLLEAIRRVADSHHFTNQKIEITVLQSLALERQGYSCEAVVVLREAVDLAAPGGWVRPFIEAGPSMASMLERVREPCEDAAFIRQVLAEFSSRAAEAATSIAPAKTPSALPPESSAAQRTDRSIPSGQTVRDTLTNRELEVLELLAQRLQSKEIAARMCISAQTVSFHLKNIYRKLGVHSRRQAVDRAVETGILLPGTK